MRDAILATLTAVSAAGLAVLSEPWIGQSSSALFVVLGVAVAGAMFGLVAAMVSAIGAFLVYNFFLAEPSMTFSLATKEDLVPLVAFTLAALVTGALAGRLKDREQATRAANLKLAGLLKASRALQAAVTTGDVVAIAARIVATDGLEAASAAVGTAPEEDYLAGLSALVALAHERADLSARVAEGLAATRSEELKTALLASVSHDLRTPLAAIIASASSLSDYGDTLPKSARASLLRTIVSEGERLDRLTANLLELSRLQAGIPLPVQFIDPADIVTSAAARVHRRLAGRLIGRVPTGAYLVQANPQLFEAAVANLLDNAAVHAPDGPVEIAARADGDQFELSIADHGGGIPAAERERVFDRFYRLDPARPGSGLGLAIAKGFVAASHGTIAACNREDGLDGARLVVRLPLAREVNDVGH